MASFNYRNTSGVIFAAVAIGHAIRAIRALPVEVGDGSFPIWLSWVAAVVAGVLPALHATGRRAQDTLKQASGADGLRLGRVWTVMIVAQVATAMIGLPITIKISLDGIQRGLTKANYSEGSFLAATVSADPDAPAGTVVGVVRPGYGDGEHQLRPAAVVVAAPSTGRG